MNKIRIAYEEVLPVAVAFIWEIKDVVDRLAIAGSLRRGVAEVKDVEIVARPTYIGATNMLEYHMQQMLLMNVVHKRKNRAGHDIAWGQSGQDSRFKAFVFREMPIDLFIVLPDRQWGPTFLIRTGSGRANEALVTRYGVRNRNGDRGLLPEGLRFGDGAVWRGSERLDTPEEEDVFNACHLPWIAPPYRTPAEYAKQHVWWNDGVRQNTEPTCGLLYGDFKADGIWQFDKPRRIPGISELGERGKLPGEYSSPIVQLSLF